MNSSILCIFVLFLLGYVGTIHVTGRGRCVAYTKEAMQGDNFSERRGKKQTISVRRWGN
ncbi:hypothetical protein V6Z12_D01G202400 [Gossypium hirsutum]